MLHLSMSFLKCGAGFSILGAVWPTQNREEQWVFLNLTSYFCWYNLGLPFWRGGGSCITILAYVSVVIHLTSRSFSHMLLSCMVLSILYSCFPYKNVGVCIFSVEIHLHVLFFHCSYLLRSTWILILSPILFAIPPPPQSLYFIPKVFHPLIL